VEVAGDRARQAELGLHGVQIATLDARAQLPDFGQAHVGEQLIVAEHQLVADRHHFGEHDFSRFVDADVVAHRLGHLVDAVGAFQQRRGGDDLGRLPVVALDFAAHQQVELLVAPAQLHVGVESDRIVSLGSG